MAISEQGIQVIGFASIPVVGMAIGGAIAAFWPPTARMGGYIQHFAAGIVFAAASGEVLPDVMQRRAPVAASIGFALGVALMLVIRALVRKFEAAEASKDTRNRTSFWSMVAIVGIDVLVDGRI